MKVDMLVTKWYERLGNIQQQDVWGGYVTGLIVPHHNHNHPNNKGYSYMEEAKYGKKSQFMQDFYTRGGNGKNVY